MSQLKAVNDSIRQNIPVQIPLGQLRRSPKNMRTVDVKNSPEDKAMVASIRATGLIQNLSVYKEGDHYEVPAGGRRFGGLEYLLKKGEITDEFPVNCIIIPKEDATNTSLIENYQRKAPHPADVYTAFNALITEGRSVADIAKNYGIPEAQVQRYLRLGKVHKTLFNLFKKDKLTLDQVMAFATTPDTKLQIATFKAIGEDCGQRPNHIREQILNNRYSSDSALAKLVSVEDYEKAGGVTETDLFTDVTVFCDVEIMVRLAEEKLLETAAKLKGWKWVDVSMEGSYVLHNYRRLPSTQIPTPKKLEAELKKLEGDIERLEEIDDDKWTDANQDQYEKLENELDELREVIERESTVITDEIKPFGGCIVTFNQNTGDIEVHAGLMTSDDVKEFQNKDKSDQGSTDNEAGTDAKAKDKAKPELSARLVDDLSLYRRSIIKSELATSPDIAVNLLHFQLCLSVIGKGQRRWTRILDVSVSTVNDESSIGDYKKTVAAKKIADAYAKLDTGWMSLKTDVKQFEAFRALSANKRNALVSFCVAQQLLSGQCKPGSDKLIDAITAEMGIDFTKFWRPSGENYFGRLTKPLLMSLGKKWFGAAWVTTRANKSKKIVVDELNNLFHGKTSSLSDKEKGIRDNWIPPQIDK